MEGVKRRQEGTNQNRGNRSMRQCVKSAQVLAKGRPHMHAREGAHTKYRHWEELR